jgi:prohibitin 2
VSADGTGQCAPGLAQPTYANLKIATAQAEALRVQNSALAQSKEVLELRRIEVEQTKANRWNGQLPQNVYAAAPIPFLNVSKQ